MLNIRIEQEFGLEAPVTVSRAASIFSATCQHLDLMLEKDNIWYQKGSSREHALQHQIFVNYKISDEILVEWEKRYKKNHPFFGEGIWDGGLDDNSAGIDLTSSVSGTGRRDNPVSLVVEFTFSPVLNNLTSGKMLKFIQHLLTINEHCTYLGVESSGYSFPKIIPVKNGYKEVFKKVFPDRISCGWMLYSPAIILPELIPEAARVVPVMKNEKQTGTIIVSTEEVFDGAKREHIEKSNDIEIRLLDLGLLPLMTEL